MRRRGRMERGGRRMERRGRRMERRGRMEVCPNCRTMSYKLWLIDGISRPGYGECTSCGHQIHDVGAIFDALNVYLSEPVKACRERGKAELTRMASGLNITDGDAAFVSACGYFELLLSRRYFDNHSTEEVEIAATCLYTGCRLSADPKPLLLVDFSEFLGINVYVLGALLLQLCKDVTYAHHLLASAKPFDPSLYFPRFAEELLNQRDMKVCETALHIIASTRSDRIEAGKIPSGLCGAALYISALSHGYTFSEPDIKNIVHSCEAMPTQFEQRDIWSLTGEELTRNVEECKRLVVGSEKSVLSCKHSGAPHFEYSLCEDCHKEFERAKALATSSEQGDVSDVNINSAQTGQLLTQITEPRPDSDKKRNASDGDGDGDGDAKRAKSW